MNDLPVISFESEHAWEAWLETQHATAQGVWLKIAKKHTGKASVSYQEALTVALCFGWIDGQKKPFDETYWLQKFTPRRPKSQWSQINRDKATELIQQGRMRDSGLQEIERAKQDGRWDAAYESQGRMTIPADFQQELDKNKAAQAFFEQLDSANRYAILYRLRTAQKPATRQKRILQFIAMLEEKKKIHN
jgi:uncharacterized protein YdeI (YjbR/CyaY-like superfamily)